MNHIALEEPRFYVNRHFAMDGFQTARPGRGARLHEGICKEILPGLPVG